MALSELRMEAVLNHFYMLNEEHRKVLDAYEIIKLYYKYVGNWTNVNKSKNNLTKCYIGLFQAFIKWNSLAKVEKSM